MPYKKGEPILWEHLTWDEAEAICKKVGMAIICVGAIEQHGPHLPVNVDISINYEIINAINYNFIHFRFIPVFIFNTY